MLSDFFKDSDACVEAELMETFAQNKTVIDLTDDDIQHFLSENKSKSTRYKDRSSINRLHMFMKSMVPPDERCVLALSADELDKVICNLR